jgi:MFS transporter, DHA1 family, multidrug resistance protein
MRVAPWLPMLLGFLTAVGPVSTDMYLPAFPAIEASLGGRPGTAQMTLATWFAGLAVGQITQGSLSDRFGRRGPLLVGTAVYTLASAACALAPDLFWLSVFRAIAAFGGSASMVIPRAIVRDLADGHTAARLMSRLILVMGVAPILAPTLGGAVLGFASWHAIFWICAGYGALCGVLVWCFLPDTLAEHRRLTLGPGALVSRYVMIARERGFITHALQGGFCMFGLFAYLGGSPTVFIELFHLTPARYGMVFGLCAAAFILASQVNALILPRLGASRVLRMAVWASFGATATLTLVAFTGRGGLIAVILPIFANMSCMGFVLPNATVGALSRQPANAASASALMGTIGFILGAISGALVGLLSDGTARPMALLMLAGAAGAILADRHRPKAYTLRAGSAPSRRASKRSGRPAGTGSLDDAEARQLEPERRLRR